MKTQTSKLLAFLMLLATIGCTNDGLELESINKKEKIEIEAVKTTNDENAKRGGDPCITFNEMPDNVQYIVFPVDMNYQEQIMLNNPEVAGFSGSFEDFYRDYMSSHFTIYKIQVSQNCDGFERWTVNQAEYDAFEGTFNGVYILQNQANSGTGTSNNNNGTNSAPSGPIDINGNPISGGTNDPNDNDPDDDPDDIEIGLPSVLWDTVPFNCFVGGCNLKFVD